MINEKTKAVSGNLYGGAGFNGLSIHASSGLRAADGCDHFVFDARLVHVLWYRTLPDFRKITFTRKVLAVYQFNLMPLSENIPGLWKFRMVR